MPKWTKNRICYYVSLFRLKENEEKAHTLEEEKQHFDEQAQELNETIKVMLIWDPLLPGLNFHIRFYYAFYTPCKKLRDV